jgi:ribonuclease D
MDSESPSSRSVGAVEPVLVADPAALEELVRAIEREPAVALDTESNSFHVYRERICLLQISTRTRDYVVDPLSVDVRPLGQVLTQGREVVLHGADYDVRCMKREWGWTLSRLFDTMTAARRLGIQTLGLSGLVQARFGVRLSKEFQRSNWGQRPLDEQQVRYAIHDTHYLLELYDQLSAELRSAGQLEAARKEFDRIAAVKPRPKVFDQEGWRRLKGGRELDGPGQAVLRALWLAREARASEIDRPPFKVLGEDAMIAIARRRPRTAEELAQISGVTQNVLRRAGDAILGALAQAVEPDKR